MPEAHFLPLQVTAADLQPRLGSPELLLLDLCSADRYRQGHLPGAIHVVGSELICGEKPATGKLPPLERLEALFSRLGLSPEKHVVVYDEEGSAWAGRLIWTLDLLGHTRYSFLDGGIDAWCQAGFALEQSPNHGHSLPFQACLNTAYRATLEEIKNQLGSTDTVIWDARSPEEYLGTKVVSARGGHIPGARNLNWLDLMDEHKKLLPLTSIETRLNQLGITANKTVITHCQTHRRSGLTYLVAKLLGYPRVKAYDGSWSEWGNREDTPVTTIDENP